MVKLEAPATHYLNAALGWVELGNPTEARIELQQIAEEFHRHPSVLLVKWEILAKEHKWDLAVELAQDIIQLAPEMPDGWIKRSYALHELKRTQEAYDFLFDAGRRFPQLSIIPYNLACYTCQLGRAQEAQRWLTKAMKMGDQTEIKSMALKDPDLRPIREFIEEA